ncbi:beta-ketoacyl synthase N-terminal-like domain-containing protein [Streptomyces sp. S1A(2023)]
MACRFPGAQNVNQYWRLLMEPRAQFSAVPDARWRRAGLLSDDVRDASSVYTDTMALLRDVGHFDAEHYGVPPRRCQVAGSSAPTADRPGARGDPGRGVGGRRLRP